MRQWKKIWKSVYIWQRYGQKLVAYFLGPPCICIRVRMAEIFWRPTVVTAVGFCVIANQTNSFGVNRYGERYIFLHGGRPPYRMLKIFDFRDMSFVIVPVCYKIQISSKSDYFSFYSLMCGDMVIFNVAVVRQFEFSKFDVTFDHDYCRILLQRAIFSENRTIRCS